MNTSLWITLLQVLGSGTSDTLVVPLQEVVVTGTRTPTSVLRAPAAVSVIDRKEFGDRRGLSLKDALEFVPGVLVQSRAGAQDIRVTIRGFGARGNGERSNAGSMRGVRIMSDGIPLTEPDGRTSLDLADLGIADRVEVARSNSSTLYGNASGGVVHMRTNLQFPESYLEYRQRAGSFGFHREQGVTGFVIGSGRGVFLLSNAAFGGWREHSEHNATLASLRLSTPLDDRTRLGLLLDGVSDLNRFPGPLTRTQLDSFPQQANARFVSRDERRRNQVGRVGLSLDRSLSQEQGLTANVFVEPKVLQRSERGRFRDFNRYHVGGGTTFEDRRSWGEHWRGATLLGIDEAFQDGSILFYDLNPDGSRATTLRANKREAANSAGGFIQQELTLHRWSLRLAGRFDHIRYISADRITPQLNDEKAFRRWTPKGSLSYAFDHHTWYAALGGGVEAPAFNEIDPPDSLLPFTSLNPFLKTMVSTTYEAGLKGEWSAGLGEGLVGYDLAVYQIDVENDIVPWGGGAYFLTAGKSRRRGAEVGLDWTPVRAVSVKGALNLSDNEYLDYQNNLGDLSGRTVPGLPRFSGAFAVRWLPVTGLTLGVSSTSIGDYFADDENVVDVPGYTLVGASASYERRLGGRLLRAFIAGDNLTDEAHVASVFINPLRDANGDFEAFEPGLPRSWSGGLTLRW